jgi:hypothetical protein
MVSAFGFRELVPMRRLQYADDIRERASWSFETGRFFVGFYAEPEEFDPADSFDDESDIAAVREGRVEWFCASVRVFLKDEMSIRWREVGADHLGGCAYERVSDFYTSCRDGYFRDMVRLAVAEARATLARDASVAGSLRSVGGAV